MYKPTFVISVNILKSFLLVFIVTFKRMFVCLSGCKGIQLCQVAPDSKRHVCGVYTSVYGDKTCYFSFLVSVLNGRIEPGTWWWSWCILINYCACTHPVQDYPLYMGVPTGGLCSLLRLLLLQCDVGGSTDAPHLLGSSNIANVLQVYLQQGVCLSGYLFKLKRAKCENYGNSLP